MEKRPVFMICYKESDKPHVPSLKDKCSKCGGAVWVSPASMELAKSREAKFVCTDCMPPTNEIRELDLRPSSQQIKEMMAHPPWRPWKGKTDGFNS